MSSNVRKYIYTLLTPLGAVAVFYGLLSGEEVALWLALAGTALMTASGTMAAVNTKGKDDAE
jgi:hypothetical protein